MRRDSTTRSMASPITPASALRRDSSDECFKSPSVSAFPRFPSSSRRPSQAFKAPLYASSSTAGRHQDVRLSPISSVSQHFTSEQSPSYTAYHQSPFFSQSSGNFVPPLESTCRFPLSTRRRAFALKFVGNNMLTDFFRPIDSTSIWRSAILRHAVQRDICVPTSSISYLASLLANVEEPTTRQARQSIPLPQLI
jgi:hypothetical protein